MPPQQIIFQQISGGVVFRIAYNGDSPAAGNHYISFRHILLSIVSAFGMNIRPQQANKTGHIRRIKNSDCVNVAERRQKLSAFLAWDARPAFPFESARARIGIHGHDQPAAQFLCGAQIPDMPDVKKIKTSVGQNDLFSSRTPLPDLGCQPGWRKNFLCGPWQSALHDGAQKFSAGYGGGTAFHHHNAAGVVGQACSGFRVGPRSKGRCVSGDNGVSCSGYVSNFI